jgi:hypothetical protein
MGIAAQTEARNATNPYRGFPDNHIPIGVFGHNVREMDIFRTSLGWFCAPSPSGRGLG